MEARVAYENYLTITARAAGEGDEGAQKLHLYLTERAVKAELEDLRGIRARGLKISGQGVLKRFQVQSFDAGSSKLSAYACVDLSGARVLNENGKDVTPQSRADLQTSLPQFVMSDNTMKMTENAIWTGESIC